MYYLTTRNRIVSSGFLFSYLSFSECSVTIFLFEASVEDLVSWVFGEKIVVLGELLRTPWGMAVSKPTLLVSKLSFLPFT